MTSKIKVDNIENQCGGAVVTKCGATTTISGSVVKADDIQAADGGNLINQCGTTITLGASGDTISLASGASQTGFGRTGTVDWQTGDIKTATFTAANGEGYFCNTSGGAFTMNLPAGSAGAIVSVVDYTNTFQTNNLTISPNGAEKIGGFNTDAILSTQGQSVTFVYVDATEGWKNTMDSTSNVTGLPPFVQATGGTITCSGDFKIHTFTGPGTFTVTNAGTPAGSTTVDYMVVAGGGSGPGGGGGAGGFRESSGAASGCYSASPLGACVSALPVTAQGYPITVGAAGANVPCAGSKGNNGGTGGVPVTESTGGGGGAGGAGSGYSPGPGVSSSISGSSVPYAIGGSGECYPGNPLLGPGTTIAGIGRGSDGNSANAGIVIIRYKFQ